MWRVLEPYHSITYFTDEAVPNPIGVPSS